MKNIFSAILMMCLMLVSSVVLTACSEEDVNTDQYLQGVHLNVYGPSPVMRGGELRFLGSNLDQVAQVIIPGVDPITNIEVVKSGVPSEIRVTVPHDGPEPGTVKLVTRTDEVIETITPLTYSEPITIESVSPSAVMPGDEVTIKGDYLSNIHAVAFAENEVIGEANFVSHDRYSIVVKVPETARTGKLALYDADITAMDDASSDVTYNIIYTDDALTVGTPTVAKLASPRGEAAALGTITTKQGETVTITGNYFQLVKSISFGDVESELGLGTYTDFTNFTVSKDGKTLTFTLPAEATDGSINFVAKSGVEIPVGKLVTVAPTNVAAAPLPVKALNSLTITGTDLDVICQLQFPNCDVQDVTVNEEGKIIVQVPETAQEGDIQLIMKNGKKTAVSYTLVKPVATGFNMNPAAAGSDVEIQGTDLDLVKSVTFTGGTKVTDFTVAADGTTLTVTVPLDAESGAITLNLANGTSVETPALEVSKPVFCYIPDASILTENELKAGELLTVEVENADHLTGVQIDGKDCQYVNNGGKLYIGIPETAGKNSTLTLISDNGKVTYDLAVTPNTEQNYVIWTGAVDLNAWSINWQFGDNTQSTGEKASAFADINLQAGDEIRIYATNYNDWWQVQFFDGHWNGQTEIGNATGLNNGNNINSGIYDLSCGYISIPVTETLATQLTTLNDWGYCWIMQGEGIIINKITVTRHISLETTLWEGEAVADDWGNQPYLLTDGGAEFSANEVKAGQTVRFYITPTDTDWKLQVVEGHWGDTYISVCNVGNGDTEGGKFTEYDLAAHKGAVELTLTQAMIDKALTQQWWGGIFLLNGDNVKCTKITVE